MRMGPETPFEIDDEEVEFLLGMLEKLQYQKVR